MDNQSQDTEFSDSSTTTITPSTMRQNNLDNRYKFNFHFFYILIIFIICIFVIRQEIRINKIESERLYYHKMYNTYLDNTREYLFRVNNDLNNHFNEVIGELYKLRYKDVEHYSDSDNYIIK